MLFGIRCRTAMGCSHGPGPAGVEKIIEVLCGMGMLLGSRIATPTFVGAIRCPSLRVSPDGVAGCVGAWWLENWIVDASKILSCFVRCNF